MHGARFCRVESFTDTALEAGGLWGAPCGHRGLPYFSDHVAAASLSASKSRQKPDLGLLTLNTKGLLDNTSDSWSAGLNFESLEASRERERSQREGWSQP